MASPLAAFVELWHQGGFVMPWLVGSTVVLWYAIGDRLVSLRRGDRRPLDQIVAAHLQGRPARPSGGILGTAIPRILALSPAERTPGRVREQLAELYAVLQRHRVLIRGLAATAPLVGLLGTVTGMIETFDSLTTMSLHRGSGGVAGGISEALISTQMGLVVAIPGLLVGRLLDRRQATLEAELDALGDLLADPSRPGDTTDLETAWG